MFLSVSPSLTLRVTVTFFRNAPCFGWWVCAAEGAQPLIRKLEPATRAKVLAALAGLVILGFALMALAWLGAHATRRYMQREGSFRRIPRRAELDRDDWAEKPLIPGAKDTEQDNET